MPLLLIGLGGFAGAIARYAVDGAVSDRTGRAFPWGTLVINATGSFVLGFLFALSAVGVDLTALSVLGGALGVGLGFGLQKLAANYVSGFVILAERSLRIGDRLQIVPEGVPVAPIGAALLAHGVATDGVRPPVPTAR